MSGRGRAIFLDRDGTLVEPRHYPRTAAELVLFAGVGAALAPLQAAGFKLVLVTNQSGVAHGFFGEAELGLMHDHLAVELGRHGVRLDGVYFCPHHPEGTVASFATGCDCRKPAPGMVLRAVAELDVDPARSWFVGDILADVEAGNRAGCRTVLVDLGTEAAPDDPIRRPDFVARGTTHALAIVAGIEGVGPPAEVGYAPLGWREDRHAAGAAR